MVLGLGVLSNMTMAGREPRRRSCLNSCEVSHNAPSLILGQPCVYDRAVAEGAAACYLLVLSVSNRPVKFIERQQSVPAHTTTAPIERRFKQAERNSQGL